MNIQVVSLGFGCHFVLQFRAQSICYISLALFHVCIAWIWSLDLTDLGAEVGEPFFSCSLFQETSLDHRGSFSRFLQPERQVFS